MKNLYLILGCCIVLFSCKKEDQGAGHFDISVGFVYRDVNNVDLLDPNTVSIFKAADIDIYCLTNAGEKRRIYRANLDRPEMFKVEHQGNELGYVLTLGFGPDGDCYDQNNKATMYIRYKDGSEDTLVGEFNSDRGNGYTQLKKLWVNNKLEWSGYPASKLNLVLKK